MIIDQLVFPRAPCQSMTRLRSSVGVANFFFILLACFISYYISLYLLDRYVGGDRYIYRNLYNSNELDEINIFSIQGIIDLNHTQQSYTGSKEPLYGILVWISSRILNTDTFTALTNSIMSVLMILFLLRYRVSIWIIVLLLTNFYFVVLATSADRVKFSFIMMLVALLSEGSFRRNISLLFAPLFHAQTLIIYASISIGKIFQILRGDNYLKKKFSKKYICYFFGISIFILVIVIYYTGYIYNKLMAYMNFDGNISALLVLTIITILTFRTMIQPIIAVGSLCVAAFIIGESRVNMIGYMVYAFYCITYFRTKNIYFLVISLYLSYKSIGYISNILEFGNGFAVASIN